MVKDRLDQGDDMKKLLITTLFLVLVGCATSGKINSVSIGMKKYQVIATMGKPVSVSAKGGTEYLNYNLSETDDDAFIGRTSPYYVRLINGSVDSFGRTGDFDSTKSPTVKIESNEKVSVKGGGDLYTELRKLKELNEEGIISDIEYQQQKGRVLNKY